MPPSVTTHNLLLQCYVSLGRLDTALEELRLLQKEDSVVTPSPSSYRVVIQGLVDNGRLNEAIKIKNEMLEKGFVGPDCKVYNFLMGGFAKGGNGDEVVALFKELKEKLAEDAKVSYGAVCGNLMKGYFLKGMDNEAMNFYNEVIRDGSGVKFGVDSYNSALNALGINGKLDEAIKLFERMEREHDPPRRIALDCRSFDFMVDAYCFAGEFGRAVMTFGKMEEKNINPGVRSYNNLIEHLVRNQLVAMAEEVWKEMVLKKVDLDESTYVLLMKACFGVNRVNNAFDYFNNMVESGLKPSLIAHEVVINGLVDAGKVDIAWEVFVKMPERGVKPSTACYELLLKAYLKIGNLEDGIQLAKQMLLDERVIFRHEMKELLVGELRKGGREEEMEKLYEEVEQEKVEAAAREAEERERAKSIEKEEREKRRAELVAKEAAAAAASKAAIEAILGSRRNADAEEEAPSDGRVGSSEFLNKFGISSEENRGDKGS
jgi:pentatricopeptide repeat protein